MLFFSVPNIKKSYVNFGDLSKMMITILPEPVALVGWSPNSQDLFYSWVLSTASATAPSDKFFSKKLRLDTLGALDFGKGSSILVRGDLDFGKAQYYNRKRESQIRCNFFETYPFELSFGYVGGGPCPSYISLKTSKTDIPSRRTTSWTAGVTWKSVPKCMC